MAQNEFTVAISHIIPGADHLIDALPDLGGDDTPDVGDMGQDSAAVEQLAEQLQHGQDQIAASLGQSQANWDAALGGVANHDMGGYFGDETVGGDSSHGMPGSDS